MVQYLNNTCAYIDALEIILVSCLPISQLRSTLGAFGYLIRLSNETN